ncbi:MAG: site-specific integrase [Ruminococcus sp.]|nr:site-specific integrase [Ruminococcus sp.]
MADRYDPKGRKLRSNEYYDTKTGRYRYIFKDESGKNCTLYSWTLTKSDIVPRGKKQKCGESLREKIQALNDGTLQREVKNSDNNMTVYELMERYIKLKWNDVRESTRSGYRTQLKFMKNNKMGKRKIYCINTTEAEEWMQELHDKNGKNYSTLHVLRGILRPAFTMAKRNKWITDNPFDFPLLKKRYGGTKTREAISKKDMRRFLDFVRTDQHFSRYFPQFYILFFTGIRVSEFCGLVPSDIDFEKHVIHVKRQLIRIHDGKKMLYFIEEGKTKNAQRDLPLTRDLESVFRNVLAERKARINDTFVWNREHTDCERGFIWLDKNDNYEVAQHIENHFRWAVKKFNRIYKDELPEITPHVARHTYCSNLISQGLNPKAVQYLMGHSSVDISLDIYTTLEKKDVERMYLTLVNNPSFDFYPLDNSPVIVAPSELDDSNDEPDEIDE